MNEQVIEILNSSIQVIDMVTPRGAFRGDELLAVGTLRQQLVALVYQIQNPEQPPVEVISNEPSVKIEGDTLKINTGDGKA